MGWSIIISALEHFSFILMYWTTAENLPSGRPYISLKSDKTTKSIVYVNSIYVQKKKKNKQKYKYNTLKDS